MGRLHVGRRHIIAQLRKATIAPREDNAMRRKGEGVILSEGDSNDLDLGRELNDRRE
jgi:hypothetical protein